MTLTRSRTDDDGHRGGRNRAQSHAVGFIILLGLSIAVVGGGAYYGLSGLQEASAGAPAKTAESSLSTLRGDFYDLDGGAPYRATPVEIYDGTLHYGDPVRIRVSATAPSESMGVKTFEFRPIIIEAAGNSYIYSGGSVLRATEDGAFLKTGPKFRIDSEDAYIPLFEMTAANPDREVAIGSRGTVSMALYKSDTELTKFEPTDGSGTPETATVTIVVETPRADAWALYFREHSDFQSVSVSASGDRVTAEFETKRLYLRRITTETRIDPD
jgi:hypothetical protein